MIKLGEMRVGDAIASACFWFGIIMAASTIVSARWFADVATGRCWFVWSDWIWLPYVVLAWRSRSKNLQPGISIERRKR